MASNKSPSYGRRYMGPSREVKCSCGGTAKMRKSKVYPFGKNSKPRSITCYSCKSCGKKFN